MGFTDETQDTIIGRDFERVPIPTDPSILRIVCVTLLRLSTILKLSSSFRLLVERIGVDDPC